MGRGSGLCPALHPDVQDDTPLRQFSDGSALRTAGSGYDLDCPALRPASGSGSLDEGELLPVCVPFSHCQDD